MGSPPAGWRRELRLLFNPGSWIQANRDPRPACLGCARRGRSLAGWLMTTMLDPLRWRPIAEALKPGPYLVCNEQLRDWWAVAVRNSTGAWVTDDREARALCHEPTHFMSLPLPPRAALDEEAFWALVDRTEEDECWAWRGSLSAKTGHGIFQVGRRHLRPYRIAWALHNGQG